MLRRTLLATATLGLGLAFGGAAMAQDKTKACWVYVGPIEDFGWTYQHHQGLEAVKAAYGDKVETAYVASVPEADSERAIERLARDGCNIIFTTSFGFMEPTLKVAKKFPDVKFEHATGYKTAENVTTYNAKFHEGRYVIGQIAAKVSKTGTAGYIASFPIPEVIAGINAFMLGAQSVNPDFKVKIVWANTWFDPGKEADAAKALFDQGVDILTQHTDTTAPMQVAEERGMKAFGQASDMIAAGPTAQLSAIVDTWAPYYIKRTQAVLDGTWSSAQTFDGLVDGILSMAPYTNMPDDVKAMAMDTEAKIKSGELKPFTGPLNKQDGSVWLAEGESADYGTILGMNFYIEGVDDKLPQ